MTTDFYASLAAAGTVDIAADPSGKQIHIMCIKVTSDGAAGAFITLADNATVPVSKKIFVAAGINELEHDLVFTPGAKVTITATTGAATVFLTYDYK